MNQTKFTYVQIGANDYKALADFYVKALGFTICKDNAWLDGKEGICLAAPGFESGTAPVFGCVNTGSQKDHQGSYKEQVIGVPNVHVTGQHVLLPGLKKDYPTLEIFTYSVPGRALPCEETARGINAIGFFCENAQTVAEQMVQAGGIINEKTDSRIVAGDLQNGRILLRQK